MPCADAEFLQCGEVPGSNYDDVDYFIIRYFPVDNPSEVRIEIELGNSSPFLHW